MWKEGVIGVPLYDGSYSAANYRVKVEDSASPLGINQGKITVLTIKIAGVITADYKLGWDIKPNENDESTQIAYCILLMEYN